MSSSTTTGDKDDATIELGTDSSNNSETKHPRERPHWIQWGPLAGIAALCLTVGCSAFALAILIASNNQPVDTWTVQPTVYIAVAAAIANTSIAFAYGRAVPIAWWYQASKGATIRALEQRWQIGSSVSQAVRYGRRLTWTTGVAILVAVMIVDGPLLQRASKVVSATQTSMVELNISLAPELPTGFSGGIHGGGMSNYGTSSEISTDWLHQKRMVLPSRPPCKGVCTGKVVGAGITKTNCTTSIRTIPKEDAFNTKATWSNATDGRFGTYGTNPAFVIGLSVYDRSAADISVLQSEAAMLYVGLLDIAYLQDPGGNYTAEQCYLVPALLEYDVLLDGENQLSINTDGGSIGRVVSRANNTDPGWDTIWYDDTTLVSNTSYPTALGWFTSFLNGILQANVSARAPVPNVLDADWVVDAGTFNAQAMKYMTPDGKFFDPTRDIIQNYNELMFRGALKVADWSNLTSLMDPGLSPNQTMMANQTLTQNVFKSDYRWFAGATVLEVIVIMAVLPMFWGWWTLHRDLDLSPFALGLALNAPLLRDANAAEGVKGMLRTHGDTKVRYGFVVAEHDATGEKDELGRRASSGTWRVGIGESWGVVHLTK
ncbi:hypothetical protein B0A48_11080 [Cryoendolithus antarcticus]|uniref:Uncharacterized protein n=1 Tax=Cryoendolithus antarcticus TaxID=1507870 RepID=A0A1V8SUD4_9PEZI|nr:hypothetical protein B0A48_11080 [Cryoendolithus antarcticus]